MKYDAKEFKRYPEIMSKEQMRIACHISKRTALYLLQFNLIPHTFTGKKTRCYAIKKSDVIAFMNDRDDAPPGACHLPVAAGLVSAPSSCRRGHVLDRGLRQRTQVGRGG